FTQLIVYCFMEFIHNPEFQHPFFKDVVRIDYHQGSPQKIINDFGYSYLMMIYGDFYAIDPKEGSIHVPRIFVKPTGDYFRVTSPVKGIWITFEMPPTFFHKVTGLKTREYRNVLKDLNEIITDGLPMKLYNELENKKAIEDIVSITDHYLSPYYSHWSREVKCDEIVAYIFEKNGLLSKDELIDKFPYSERTLERMFNEEVGTSPSRFIRLIRFNFIVREIEQGSGPISELINRYNYYDQSHFERDFKKFLGQSIKSYKNDMNPMLTEALAREYVK
ncbi:MAG: AraC family transcriptional regulator, partial [Bacteroidota bacterium]